MPTRIIREGWIESERIAQLTADEERFFLRLCLRADDYGRYTANPRLLVAALFPLCENVQSTDLPGWLAACEKAGLIRCYEVDSKPLLAIPRFGQRTRAMKSKYPAPPTPDGQMSDKCLTSDGHMSGRCLTGDGHPRTEAEIESGGEAEAEQPKRSMPPPPDFSDPASPIPNPRAISLESLRATWPDLDIDKELKSALRHKRKTDPAVQTIDLAWFAAHWLPKCGPAYAPAGASQAKPPDMPEPARWRETLEEAHPDNLINRDQKPWSTVPPEIRLKLWPERYTNTRHTAAA